jgi:hypothetical protein
VQISHGLKVSNSASALPPHGKGFIKAVAWPSLETAGASLFLAGRCFKEIQLDVYSRQPLGSALRRAILTLKGARQCFSKAVSISGIFWSTR